MKYPKPALTFHEQFGLLASRGLAVPDPERAMRWLRHVSYFRLSAYFLPFKSGENFKPGTTFDRVAGLYIFDRKLRLILLDAIERIEVALRTALTYEIAHRHGPFGYADAANFGSRFGHRTLMSRFTRLKSRPKKRSSPTIGVNIGRSGICPCGWHPSCCLSDGCHGSMALVIRR